MQASKLSSNQIQTLTDNFKKFYEKQLPSGAALKDTFNGNHPLYNKIEIPLQFVDLTALFPLGFNAEDLPNLKIKLSMFELYWLTCVEIVQYENCPPLSAVEAFICHSDNISEGETEAIKEFIAELKHEVKVSYELLVNSTGSFKNSTYPTLNDYRMLNVHDIERESNILFSRIRSMNEAALSERFYMTLVNYLVEYAGEANEPHIIFLDYALNAVESMLKDKDSFEHAEFEAMLKSFSSEEEERAITEAALTMYMDSNKYSVEINEVLTVFELMALRLATVLALEKFTVFKESCELSK